MNWFEMDIKERIEKVYSQYAIRDFFSWWSGKNNNYMEVRITDFNIIREIAWKHQIPFSISGLYVRNSYELKQVIMDVRERATVWFGINSRKRNFNKYGKKVFGGLDTNVEAIEYVFIDIDRIKKEGPASNEELSKCDELANRILKKLDEVGWANAYAKICTGNGVQLLLKLDYAIRLPEVEFKKERDGVVYPVYNEEFEKTKRVIREGFGKQLLKYSSKFKEELGVEVDKTGFNIGRVGALPWTKNFKYSSFTWRGIIELKEGLNVGLTDYILSRFENEEQYKKHPIFTRIKSPDRRLKVGKLRENELVQFMLTTDFPSGGINNTLWMQLKCLLRDSRIDLNSVEWRQIHEELKVKHKRTFTLNMPEENYVFNEDTINKYCIENSIPPLYKLWEKSKTLHTNMCLEGLSWNHLDRIKEGYIKLPIETTIWEDLECYKKELKEGDYKNIDKTVFLIRGLIEKYGEDRAKYLTQYVLKDYFSRSSK